MPKWFSFGREKRNNLAIGIDFGTTMSRITYVESSLDLPVQYPPEIPSVPSVVSGFPGHPVRKIINWRVGESALDSINNKSRIKLEIGAMEEIYENEEFKFRPEVLAGRLVYELKKVAEKYKNSLKDVMNATITVPAEWDIVKRSATVFAARIAGFTNVNLIEEPVAAYLAISQYMQDIVKKANKILVFDCGGGTLDITVIENEEGKLPYVAGRATSLSVSGENIDDELAKRIVGDVWNQLIPQEKRELARQVKVLKEALNPIKISSEPISLAPQTRKVNIGPIVDFQLTLTLELHNQVVQEMMVQARDFLDLALASCYINGNHVKLESTEIDCVILVGGSCYLRPLQNMIKEYFGSEINQEQIILYRPEELVANGAALWQSYVENGVEKFQPTLPMKTYLVLQEWENGDLIDREFVLGNPGDILPIEIPKGLGGQISAPIINIPKGVEKIEWFVNQSFAYSNSPVPVEWIKYEGKISGLEKIRLEYIIGRNGTITKWKPSFIFGQDKDITPEPDPYYDWSGKNPGDVAREFYIR